MADVTSRLRLVVDSTGVDKAGNDLNNLRTGAKLTDDAIGKLNRAFPSLGESIQTTTRAQAAFLLSLNDQVAVLGKSQTEIMRYKAAQLGIGDAAESAIVKIEAFNNSIERSARSTAAMNALGSAISKMASQAAALKASYDPVGSSIERVNVELEQANALFKAGALSEKEFAEAQTVLNARLDSLKIKKFGDGLQDIGVKAKLTNQEMYVLGVQVKDFAESVISGQGLLRPAIQQSLAFGSVLSQTGVGFSAAVKQIAGGIGGLIAKFAPLIAAASAAAAAVAAVGFALLKMHEGAEESIKVINSLNATGESAGLTSAKFYALGDSISKATGTSAQSVRALELEVVRSGQATSESLGLITESSILLSKAMGVDASNALKTLMPLLGDTQKAAAQLNDQFHFLTVTQYEQIASLQAAGDKAGAVKLTFDLLDKKIGDHAENLGILEKSWKGVGLMIQAAIDKMMEWGRVSTPSDKQAQKLKDLQNEYDVLQNKISQTDKGNLGGRGAATEADRSHLTLLNNQLNAWKALNVESAKFDVQQQKESSVNDALIQYESSGKFGQMNALEEKRSNLEYAIANHIGNQTKNALMLKETVKEIADLDKSTYGSAPKIRKTDIPDMTRDLESYSDAAAKAVVAFNDARQAAIIRSGEKTIFAMSENAALFAGNADQLRYLDAQKQVLADNKNAFDEINLQQQAGIVLTDKQVDEQKELLDRLTKEEILRRRNTAAAKAAYDVAQQVKKTSQLKSSLEFGGFESYQLMKQTLDLMSQYPDLSYQAAQEDARRLIINQKIQDAVDKTAQRLSDLSDESRTIKTYDGLTGAFDNFFDDLTRKGGAAFKELAASFTDIFAQAFSDALKAAFDPFVEKFKKAMSDAVTSAIGSFGADGKSGKGLLGTIEKGIDGIFGKGSTAKVASWGTNVLGGYAAGAGLVSATGLNGKTAAQQLNSAVGSAVGAAIGSFIPGVGTIIGSIVGGILGGLLGPKSADNRAAANLTSSGALSGSIYGKPTDETSSALNSVIGAISSGYDALKKLGGTLGATINSLHIGNRDQSQATLSNGQTVNAGSVGDAADLANDALLGVLKATTFASESLNKIKDAMIAAGSSFDDTYGALSSVQAIMKSITPALSDWKQRLQDIDDIFKPLIASTGQYSAALVQAYNATKTALTAAFDTDINSKLLAARNSGAASYATMLQEQFTRMTDLSAVGGNLSKVLALNEQETRNFVDSLNGDYSSLTDLKTAFNDLKRAAALAGQDVTALTTVFNKSLATIADQFNKDIGSQIKGYLTSPTDQLNDLLKSQADRLEQAKAAGADIAQVERLTSLELQGFFKGLSDDALKEVSSFLGLFDQATNSVVKNLDLSRQDLQGRADSFAQFAETFSQLNTDLTQKYLAASPRESLGLLRGNVNDLLAGVKNGNDKAAQDLPDAINKLVDAARATYGNTDGFNEILAFAQSTLAQAKDASLGVQSDAEKQIAALDANNDILSDIRDILQSSSATNSFFQSYLSGGVASSDALLALIQQGAGLTTTAANDNASALNITGLIAQSVQPIIAPLAASIDNFTQRLATMPSLQQLTIEAVDRGTDNIVSAIDRLDNRMDRIETLNKKQLNELEQLPKAS